MILDHCIRLVHTRCRYTSILQLENDQYLRLTLSDIHFSRSLCSTIHNCILFLSSDGVVHTWSHLHQQRLARKAIHRLQTEITCRNVVSDSQLFSVYKHYPINVLLLLCNVKGTLCVCLHTFSIHQRGH